MDIRTLESLSLEEKIGQLFVIGFHSDAVDGHARRMIADHRAGNAVLFRRNFTGRARLQRLSADLQALWADRIGVPGWIGVDQEGGMVSRLADPYTLFPGAMAVSAGAAEAQARALGAMLGAELRDAGINMNFAPALDVNNNPRNPVIGTRSFGDDPARVAVYGAAVARGLGDAGVLAVGKHFPGHGDTATDSHLALPSVPHDRAHAEAVELPPFRAAIRAGIPAIMTTHILFPGLDPSGKPATLSPALLTDLLRGTLGFGGLIVTDCMQMQAIAGTLGTPAGCVAALAAGADLLLVCHDEDVQAASMAAVAEAVRAGALTQAQLDDRVRRVLEAKRAWLTGAATPPAAALTDAALAEHRAFAARLAADAITLLRDRDGLLPLTGKRLFSLAPAASGLSIAEDLEEGGVHFAAECAGRFGGDWCGFDVAQAPDADLRQRILAGCAQADVVLFGACNASLYPTQATLLREVLAQGTPVILCALRLPYDAALADTPAALCAYDYTPASVQALLSLLAGERPATGTLPVRLG